MFAKKGMSLAETLLFTALAILVGSVAVTVYTRGVSVTDETQKAILVQQDIRAIVEFITRDMNAAYMVWDTGADRNTSIRFLKYGSENTEKRIQYNIDFGLRDDYPFGRPGEQTENRIDSYMVSYTYNADEQTVIRHEEKGVFELKTESTFGAYVTEFAWNKDETTMNNRVIAKLVKSFFVDYFGYERTPGSSNDGGVLKKIMDCDHLASYSDEVKVSHTACILLHVMANYDEGVYQRKDRGHRAPELDFMTKIWSNPKIRDEMYHEYFSSMDWDTRY